MLAGARIPFVLRKAHNGEYDLIGEAYVHGFMQGEYFAGGDYVDFGEGYFEIDWFEYTASR